MADVDTADEGAAAPPPEPAGATPVRDEAWKAVAIEEARGVCERFWRAAADGDAAAAVSLASATATRDPRGTFSVLQWCACFVVDPDASRVRVRVRVGPTGLLAYPPRRRRHTSSEPAPAPSIRCCAQHASSPPRRSSARPSTQGDRVRQGSEVRRSVRVGRRAVRARGAGDLPPHRAAPSCSRHRRVVGGRFHRSRRRRPPPVPRPEAGEPAGGAAEEDEWAW